ncbi:MAG: hypothetical protein ACP5U0_10380, partial [Caldisphaera sp.]
PTMISAGNEAKDMFNQVLIMVVSFFIVLTVIYALENIQKLSITNSNESLFISTLIYVLVLFFIIMTAILMLFGKYNSITGALKCITGSSII